MSIAEIIENMSLEEKVGQLFQVGFSDTKADNNIKDMIENYHIGGVIYFSRNLNSLKQTAELSNQLQELALNSKSEIPLFISADQEGGIVTRLRGGTHFPGNMALGATGSNVLAEKAGKATATELKNTGINMNLAPVLDVNNNPANPVIGVRSFGEDPDLVANLGYSYFAGLQSEGVIACGKHFPGHGDTDLDSHLSLPVIRHNRERLNKIELVPFKRAIDQGIDSIMTAHVHFPAIEKEIGIPATLSKKVLTGLLRKELNFKGLIITDCMEMNAIADSFGTVEGAIRAFIAGSDVILISHSYQKQKRAIKAMKEAVKSNRISENRINTSLKRILKLKQKRIGIGRRKIKKADPKKINLKYNQRIAEEISRASVTLLKGENVVPIEDIKNKKISVVNFSIKKGSLVEDNKNENNVFIDYLNKKIDDLKHFDYKDRQGIDKKDDKEFKNSDYIIVCISDGEKNRKQIKIAEKIAENNKVITVALRNPYDFKYIKNSDAFLTTYDYSPSNQRAAVDIITGEIKAKGKLPVKVRNEKNEK